jgi:hypothetical protein
MTTPVACSLRVAASPLKGAAPAAWRSQFRGDHQAHPRRLLTACSRSAPQGAAAAARQSRFRAALDRSPFAPDASVVSVCRMRCAFSGVLRVQAAGKRRLGMAGRLL